MSFSIKLQPRTSTVAASECIVDGFSENQMAKHGIKSILDFFFSQIWQKEILFRSDRKLIDKTSKPSNQCTIDFVSDCYKKPVLSEDIKLGSTTEDCLFKLLKNVKVTGR